MIAALLLAAAQQPGPAPGGPSSLSANPQAGATPRPLPPSPTLPPSPVPPAPTPPLQPVPMAGPPVVAAPSGPIVTGPPNRALLSETTPGGLPAASPDPLHLDLGADPILALAHGETPPDQFRAAVAAAVARTPDLAEAAAVRDEAEGARNEARARRAPVLDLGASSYRIIRRAFTDDDDDVLERLRPHSRTDITAQLQQPVWDFGAGLARTRAGDARLAAAAASVDDTATQLALRAVSAWYGVFGYRALVRLGETFAATQRQLRGEVERRVGQGAAAPADLAQVDGYIAASDAELADYRRQLASAEAQYAAIIGAPAPADLARAPAPAVSVTPAQVASAADALPAVKAAELGAMAARRDAQASHADLFPQLTAGLDFGRYGVFETARDYDSRANVTLSWRIGGGAAQRLEQARARANGADARARRTREEATRDAQIAYADVQALTQARDAIEANYVASRRARDVVAERFRVARGTLFDLVAAENNFFGVAARYLQAVTELDSARYALLARTGGLLDTLGIKTAR